MVFFALATALGTALLLVPGTVRARGWAGMPLAVVALAGAGVLTGFLTADFPGGVALASVTVPVTIFAHALLRRWSTLAAQDFATLLLACSAVRFYAAVVSSQLLSIPPLMLAAVPVL